MFRCQIIMEQACKLSDAFQTSTSQIVSKLFCSVCWCRHSNLKLTRHQPAFVVNIILHIITPASQHDFHVQSFKSTDFDNCLQ